MYELASISFNNKDYKNSLKYYNNILKIDPEHKEANYNIALIYEKENEEKKALSYFKKALELDENNIKFLTKL
jgi:Tfp pilus assembly protein PilF